MSATATPTAGNWTIATDWSPSGSPTASDDVVFDQSLNTTLSQFALHTGSGPFVANSLTFGSAAGLGAFSFRSGNSGTTARTLSLTSGGITVASGVTGAQSIGNGGGTLTLDAVDGSFEITNNSTQLLNLVAKLSDATVGTTVTINDTSTGGVTFSGANAFTGGLTIKAGKLTGGSASAFGTGTITLGNTTGTAAATLATTTSSLTYANAIVLATNATSGAFTIQNDATTTNSVTYTGGVTGSNNLTITNNAGTTGGMTFSTNAINNAGTLTHTGTSTGTTTISGGLGSNVTSVTQVSSGTLVLAGSTGNTTVSGLTVNKGTLTIDLSGLATPTNLMNTAATVTLGGGQLKIQGKASTTSSQTLGALTLTADTGRSTIWMSSPTASINTNLTLPDNWTRNPGTTMRFLMGVGSQSPNTPGTKSITSSPTLTNGILPYAVFSTTSVSWATVTSGKIAAYSGASTLTASSNNATTNYSSGSINHNAGNWSVNALQFSSGATLDIGGGVLTLTSGGLLTNTTSAGTITIQNGQLGASGSEVIFHAYATPDTVISATISGGAGRFTMDGSSSIILTGANTYTGPTVIGSGVLQIGNGGTAGSLSSSGTIINKGNLTINRTDTVTQGTHFSSSGISGTGSFTQAGTGTTILNAANTYSGATTISAGTLQFAKTAALYNSTTGSWTVANVSVASGATAAFNVGGTGEFTTGNVTTLLTNLNGAVSSNGLQAGSKIAFDTTNASDGTFTIGDVIKDTTGTGGGAVGVTKLGSNTLVLTGTNTYTGATSVTGGKLVVNGSLASGSAVSIDSSGTLGGSGTIGGVTIIAGVLAPGNSPGVLTFSDAVTLQTGSTTNIEINGATARGTDYDGVNFNGGLTVNGGTLTFNISTAIANGAVLNIFDGSALTPSLTSVGVTGAGGYSGSLVYNGTDAYIGTFGVQIATFTLTSGELSFAAAAIPESSSYAVIAGLAAVSFTFLRRRRQPA